MADVPGLKADVFFGEVDAPPTDWRKQLDDSKTDAEPELTEAERQNLIGVLGFDPRELDDDSSQQFSANDEVICVQFNLAATEALKVLSLAERIPDNVLVEKGREDEPHITVKYGIDSSALSSVLDYLADFGEVSVEILGASVFSGVEHDVVKLDVDGQRLRDLNTLLSTLPNTDSHSTYIPHITLVYVNPGEGAEIASQINAAGALSKTKMEFVEAKVSQNGGVPLWVRMVGEQGLRADQFSIADPPGNRSRQKNAIIDKALGASSSLPAEIHRRLDVLLKKN